MKIGHFELFVRDPQAAKVFYRDVLDFEVTVEQDPGLVWLEKDGLEILLRTGTPSFASRYEDAPGGIVLYTEDLENARTALEARGLNFKGTVDTEKCLTFTDPDGHWFQLVNPGNF
jgi:catechol 2,3-dioxygenase-like lactoylglutathione lyase family enzyme